MATKRYQLIQAIVRHHKENKITKAEPRTLTFAVCEDSACRKLYTKLYHSVKAPHSLERKTDFLVRDVNKVLHGLSIAGSKGSSRSKINSRIIFVGTNGQELVI